MNSSDRSLDIVAIGLGQAGGNLAAEFARRGYRAMALNTARSDLSAFDGRRAAFGEMQRLYIGIDGYDGAGANVRYGRDCVIASADRIRQFVAHHTDRADIVMLAAGLGGGTGSAMSELVRVLASLELSIMALVTLPGEHESAIAKVNAVRAVSDLMKVPGVTLILVDNSRLAEQHASAALDEYFQRVNAMIVEPLDSLNRLNRRQGLRSIRSLDGENLRTLFTAPGVLNYAESRVSRLDVGGIMDWVTGALDSSSLMPAGFVMADITYLGFVVEASKGLLATTPFALFNELSERLKSVTANAGIYLGVYHNDQVSSDEATLRMLASTSTLPRGIQTVVDAAQSEGDILIEKLSRSVESLDLGKIIEFDLRPRRLATSVDAGPLGHRRPSRGRPTKTADALVTAVAQPGEPHRPSHSGAAHERVHERSSAEMAASRSPARTDERSDGEGKTAARAERDTYDQLVAVFLDTDSEAVRRGITPRRGDEKLAAATVTRPPSAQP